MTSVELLKELRDVLRDTVTPYLWSDVTLLNYLAEGQNKLSSDCGFFRDSRSYSLTTVIGTQHYAKDPAIRTVLDIKYSGVSVPKYDPLIHNDAVFYNGGTGAAPNLWTTHIDSGFITLSPTPSAVITLPLVVERNAKIRLTRSANPELPEDIHLGIVAWAASKAYKHNDTEVVDNSRDFKAEYFVYMSEGKKLARKMYGEETKISGNPIYNLGC